MRALEVGSAIEPGTSEWRGVRVVHEAERGLHAIIDGGAARLPFGAEADVVERAMRAFVARDRDGGLDALDALVWALHRALGDAHRDAGVSDEDLAFHARLSIAVAWLAGDGVAIAHVGRCRAHHLRGAGRMPPERLTLDHTMRARFDFGVEIPEQLAHVGIGPTLGWEAAFDRVDLCRVHPAPGDVLVLTSPEGTSGLTTVQDAAERARLAPDEIARRVAVHGAVESARAAQGGWTRGAAAIAIAARPMPGEGPYR